MPYITKARKNALMGSSPVDCAGELNYTITRLINDYVRNHGLNYQTLNDIEGALSNCSKEFNRRVVVPYEDQKIEQNGDAYDFWLIEKVHGR